MSKFLIDDIKLRLALPDSDTNKIDDAKEAVEKIMGSNVIDYKFINPFYAINHAKTLLRYKDVEAANTFLKSQDDLMVDELKKIASYHLLLFEIVMQKNNGINNILLRLLDTILGSHFIEIDEEGIKNAQRHLADADECLERDYKKIHEFLQDKNFDKICLDSDKQKFNAGENMMLAHLESERELLLRFKSHIDQLRQNLDTDNTNFYIKELSSIFEDKNFESILKYETTQSFERGLDTLYSLKEISDPSKYTDEIKEAKRDILIGIGMLSSAYIPIPGLGTAIAAALSIPASKKIKSAANKLLSIILGDYDPNNYVEEEYGTEDYLLDIASSIGGPAIGVTNIFKSIAKDFGLNIAFNQVCRKLVTDCKSDVTKQISKSFPEGFKNAIEKFAGYKNNTLDTIKEWIMSTIKTPLDQISTQIEKRTTNIVDVDERELYTKAGRFNDYIKSIEESSRSIFDSIESIKNGILDIFTDFLDKLGQFKELKDLKFNLKGSKLKKIKEIANLAKQLVADQKIAQLSQGIFKVFDSNYFKPIIERIAKFPEQIGDQITTLRNNISDFTSFLLTDFKDAFGEKANELLKQIINTITTKCEAFIDRILGANPLDKFLMKYGINLSDAESTLEEMTSMAVDKFIKVLKYAIFKPSKLEDKSSNPPSDETSQSAAADAEVTTCLQEEDVGGTEESKDNTKSSTKEWSTKSNPHNQCVIEADLAMLSLPAENIAQFINVLRPSIQEKIASNRGVSKSYAKQIVQDLNYPKGVGEYSESSTVISNDKIKKILDSFRSSSAIALCASKQNPLGHAFYVKQGQGGNFVFIDKDNPEGIGYEALQNSYQNITYIIPKECSENDLSELGQEINSENYRPSHKFNLMFEIQKLWENYFKTISFGAANLRPILSSSDIFSRELTEGMRILHEIAQNVRKLNIHTEKKKEEALGMAAKERIDFEKSGDIARTKQIMEQWMKRGVGEHEMVPTCLLKEMFLRSCGASGDYYEPTSKIGDRERDWLEIQNALRVNTAHVLWVTNDGQLAGHSGAIYKQPSGSKGGQTKGQPDFHKGIEEVLKDPKGPKDPKTAAAKVIQYHLCKTLNAVKLKEELTNPKQDLHNYLGSLNNDQIIGLFTDNYACERNDIKRAAKAADSTAEHSELDDTGRHSSKNQQPTFFPSMDTSRVRDNDSIEITHTAEQMDKLYVGSDENTSKEEPGAKKFKKGSILEESHGPDNIHPIFNEYTIEVTQDILKLRIKNDTTNNKINFLEGNLLSNTIVLEGDYIFDGSDNNISDMMDKLRSLKNENQNACIVLVPFSLGSEHAVGLMFIKQENGEFKAFYIDPENTIIAPELEQIIVNYGFEIEQLITETQRYTNCGPEVIENFMLYLTGERLSQEDAIINNSRLLEQELLFSPETDNLGSYEYDISLELAGNNTEI